MLEEIIEEKSGHSPSTLKRRPETKDSCARTRSKIVTQGIGLRPSCNYDGLQDVLMIANDVEAPASFCFRTNSRLLR